MDNYYNIPCSWAIDTSLSRNEEKTLALIYSLYLADKEIFITNEGLAQRLHINPRSASRILKSLEDKKYIKRFGYKRKVKILTTPDIKFYAITSDNTTTLSYTSENMTTLSTKQDNPVYLDRQPCHPYIKDYINIYNKDSVVLEKCPLDGESVGDHGQPFKKILQNLKGDGLPATPTQEQTKQFFKKNIEDELISNPYPENNLESPPTLEDIETELDEYFKTYPKGL